MIKRIFKPTISLYRGFRRFNTHTMVSYYFRPKVFYSMGWGTLSVLNAGLADLKGRNRLNWFILSWILGPIATIYIVFFIEKEDRNKSLTEWNNERSWDLKDDKIHISVRVNKDKLKESDIKKIIQEMPKQLEEKLKELIEK